MTCHIAFGELNPRASPCTVPLALWDLNARTQLGKYLYLMCVCVRACMCVCLKMGGGPLRQGEAAVKRDQREKSLLLLCCQRNRALHRETLQTSICREASRSMVFTNKGYCKGKNSPTTEPKTVSPELDPTILHSQVNSPSPTEIKKVFLISEVQRVVVILLSLSRQGQHHKHAWSATVL